MLIGFREEAVNSVNLFKTNLMEPYIPPPRTALEIYKILPEGTRCEVIENVLYMLPPNTIDHQRLAAILTTQIDPLIEQIAEILLPVDTYFEALQCAFQPDFVIILNENARIIKDDGIY